VVAVVHQPETVQVELAAWVVAVLEIQVAQGLLEQ
jgi:hypothetical protein